MSSTQVGLPRSGYNLLAVYTGFLTVFGVLNNGIVIYLFICFEKLRQPINYFLLNLSIGDMVVSLLASPLTFASNVAGRWLFGQTGCSIYAFMVMIAGFGQISALSAISVHRCFLVVRPFTARKMSASWALFFILLIWTYSFILSIPPAFGWNEYVPEGAGTACAINWTDGKPGNRSYVIFIFVMVLAVPFVVIVASYGTLLHAVRRIGTTEAARSSENKMEGRITRMILVMITLFLVAWGPYSVFALYVASGKNRSVSPVVATLPPFFAKLCTIYNPIVYFFMNNQFKDALYQLINHHSLKELGPGSNRREGRHFDNTHFQRKQSCVTFLADVSSDTIDKETTDTLTKYVARISARWSRRPSRENRSLRAAQRSTGNYSYRTKVSDSSRQVTVQCSEDRPAELSKPEDDTFPKDILIHPLGRLMCGTEGIPSEDYEMCESSRICYHNEQNGDSISDLRSNSQVDLCVTPSHRDISRSKGNRRVSFEVSIGIPETLSQQSGQTKGHPNLQRPRIDSETDHEQSVSCSRAPHEQEVHEVDPLILIEVHPVTV